MQTARVNIVFALSFMLSLWARAADQPVAAHSSSLPAAARSSISAALGRESPEYRMRAVEGGFNAGNSRQKLVSHFTAEGVGVRNGSTRWGLSLRGYGYGDAIKAVSATAPYASSNRVEYRRGSLTEWYVNGPAGVEQGFTINEHPGKANGQPLTIALAVSGNLSAAVDPSGTGLTLTDREKRAELRYSGLAAYDADGKKLRAWMEVRGGQLLLKADDSKARYPVVIDPWLQLAELTASDATYDDYFGASVAISGGIVVVGADGATVGGNQSQGAVYVFVKPKTGWKTTSKFTAKLTAWDGQPNDQFGVSVSVSGTTIAVGASNLTIGRNQGQGAAYVYVEPRTGWKTTSKFTAKLTASDGAAKDAFGNSVSISGITAAIGANNVTINGNPSQGAAYVFVRPASGWKSTTQTAKLTSSDGQSQDFFGAVVAASGDTLVAGAPGAGPNLNQGEAYVFVRPATGWKDATQTAILTASDGAGNAYFGFVAVEAGTVVVGAPGADIRGNRFQGAAYVFVKPNSGWTSMTQTAKLTASDGQSNDQFGVVSISDNTVAIGTSGSTRGRGAVYVYVKPKKGWKTTSRFAAKLTASNGKQNDDMGFAAAVNGSTIVAGAPTVYITNVD
jgi:hypothetical protein